MKETLNRRIKVNSLVRRSGLTALTALGLLGIACNPFDRGSASQAPNVERSGPPTPGSPLPAAQAITETGRLGQPAPVGVPNTDALATAVTNLAKQQEEDRKVREAENKAILEALAKLQAAPAAPVAPPAPLQPGRVDATPAPVVPAAPVAAPRVEAPAPVAPAVVAPAVAPATTSNQEGFRVASECDVDNVERRQGERAIYAGIRTEKSPMEAGLPERPSTQLSLPTPDEFVNRARSTAEQLSRVENHGKLPSILIPDINNWGPPDWGRQSWAWSVALGKDIRNFRMVTFGAPGMFTMEKVDMSQDGVLDIILLMAEKDPKTGQNYMDDLRWGSGDMGGDKKQFKGADVGIYGHGGRRCTPIFAYDPEKQLWLMRNGGYVNNVISENGDWGAILATRGLRLIGLEGRFDLKRDALDANQQIVFGLGPADKTGRQMNVMDLRDVFGQ